MSEPLGEWESKWTFLFVRLSIALKVVLVIHSAKHIRLVLRGSYVCLFLVGCQLIIPKSALPLIALAPCERISNANTTSEPSDAVVGPILRKPNPDKRGRTARCSLSVFAPAKLQDL